MSRYFACTLLVLCASSASAQQPTQAQCDSALAAVSGQRLPSSDPTVADWRGWRTLRDCGNEGALAMAQAVQSAVVLTESDSLRLYDLFTTWWGVRSPDLYSAYTSVAQNASAVLPLRVLAINALGKFSLPEVTFFGSVLDPRATVCAPSFGNVDSTDVGAPLPSGFKSSVYATMKAIEADHSGPVTVQGAAHCWRVWLSQTQPFDPTTITLSYVCGNTFRITNTSANTYRFTYQSVGANVLTSESGTIYGKAFGPTNFTMLYFSTVRLFYNGTLLQSKANGKTVCP